MEKAAGVVLVRAGIQRNIVALQRPVVELVVLVHADIRRRAGLFPAQSREELAKFGLMSL